MKRCKVLSIFACVLLIGVFCLTGCAPKYSTLEELLNEKPEVKDTFTESFAKGIGDGFDGLATVEMVFQGNDIVVNIKSIDYYDEATINDLKERFKENYESEEMINSSKSNLEKIVEATKIDGIRLVVNFLRQDGTNFYTKTFALDE